MPLLAAIWLAAATLALGAIGWMSSLILLRVFNHRRSARLLADRRKLEGALIALLQGRCDIERDLGPYRSRARLLAETLLEFLGLVRGREREVLLAGLQSIGAPQVLRRRLSRGSDAGRLACVEALAAFPSPETEAALQAAAERGPAPMRLAALRSLHDSGYAVPVGRLLRELETGRLSPTALVGEFVRQLVAQAPASAAAELAGGELSATVQVMLIEGLTSAGDYAVLPELMRLAGSAHPDVRAAAVRALGQLNHPAAAPAVAQALQDSDWSVRAAAASAAGAIGLANLAATLVATLEDAVWRVRFSAAAALVKLGPMGRERLQQAATGTNASAQAAETAALVLAEQALAP